MAATFFGQYLQIKGIIDNNQLMQALEYQQSSNKSLGELAIEEGLLNPQQSAQINLRQRETDSLFGELAESLGWLTSEQVQLLLDRQNESHVTLGAALIKLQYVTDVTLQHLLADYHYWNQRNQRECNKRVSESSLAPQVEGFTYLLNRQLQREFGLHSQPAFVLSKRPAVFPEWTWRLSDNERSSWVGIAPAPAFVQTLNERQSLWSGCKHNGHKQEALMFKAGVSPEDFFSRLMQQLADDNNQSWLEPMGQFNDRPGAVGDSLCVGYSIEGEPLQVYFCAA